MGVFRKYYRISSSNPIKLRFPKGHKFHRDMMKRDCFGNFIDVFNPQDLVVFADNCDEILLKYLRDLRSFYHFEIVETQSQGRADSLIQLFNRIISDCDDDDLIYISEDDYLYLDDASDVFKEGIRLGDQFNLHYVGLYDHPDKYSKMYGYSEQCEVFLSGLTHWRTTISVCLSFGMTGRVFREDNELWFRHARHNHDHEAFVELRNRGRKLIIPIPGRATHLQPPWVDRFIEKNYRIG